MKESKYHFELNFPLFHYLKNFEFDSMTHFMLYFEKAAQFHWVTMSRFNLFHFGSGSLMYHFGINSMCQ